MSTARQLALEVRQCEVCEDPLTEREIGEVESHNKRVNGYRKPGDAIGWRCSQCFFLNRFQHLMIRLMLRIAQAAERIALFDDDDEDEEESEEYGVQNAE
jgi:hypothetical protein